MKNEKKNMEGLIFKIVKKPTKKGEQYYFNIPIELIRSKRISIEEDYELLCYKIKSKDV